MNFDILTYKILLIILYFLKFNFVFGESQNDVIPDQNLTLPPNSFCLFVVGSSSMTQETISSAQFIGYGKLVDQKMYTCNSQTTPCTNIDYNNMTEIPGVIYSVNQDQLNSVLSQAANQNNVGYVFTETVETSDNKRGDCLTTSIAPTQNSYMSNFNQNNGPTEFPTNPYNNAQGPVPSSYMPYTAESQPTGSSQFSPTFPVQSNTGQQPQPSFALDTLPGESSPETTPKSLPPPPSQQQQQPPYNNLMTPMEFPTNGPQGTTPSPYMPYTEENQPTESSQFPPFFPLQSNTGQQPQPSFALDTLPGESSPETTPKSLPPPPSQQQQQPPYNNLMTPMEFPTNGPQGTTPSPYMPYTEENQPTESSQFPPFFPMQSNTGQQPQPSFALDTLPGESSPETTPKSLPPPPSQQQQQPPYNNLMTPMEFPTNGPQGTTPSPYMPYTEESQPTESSQFPPFFPMQSNTGQQPQPSFALDTLPGESSPETTPKSLPPPPSQQQQQPPYNNLMTPMEFPTNGPQGTTPSPYMPYTEENQPTESLQFPPFFPLQSNTGQQPQPSFALDTLPGESSPETTPKSLPPPPSQQQQQPPYNNLMTPMEFPTNGPQGTTPSPYMPYTEENQPTESSQFPPFFPLQSNTGQQPQPSFALDTFPGESSPETTPKSLPPPPSQQQQQPPYNNLMTPMEFPTNGPQGTTPSPYMPYTEENQPTESSQFPPFFPLQSNTGQQPQPSFALDTLPGESSPETTPKSLPPPPSQQQQQPPYNNLMTPMEFPTNGPQGTTPSPYMPYTEENQPTESSQFPPFFPLQSNTGQLSETSQFPMSPYFSTQSQTSLQSSQNIDNSILFESYQVYQPQNTFSNYSTDQNQINSPSANYVEPGTTIARYDSEFSDLFSEKYQPAFSQQNANSSQSMTEVDMDNNNFQEFLQQQPNQLLINTSLSHISTQTIVQQN